MSDRERVEQAIREALASEAGAIELSKTLFHPDGLFARLAATEQKRRALAKAPLFAVAQARGCLPGARPPGAAAPGGRQPLAACPGGNSSTQSRSQSPLALPSSFFGSSGVSSATLTVICSPKSFLAAPLNGSL